MLRKEKEAVRTRGRLAPPQNFEQNLHKSNKYESYNDFFSIYWHVECEHDKPLVECEHGVWGQTKVETVMNQLGEELEQEKRLRERICPNPVQCPLVLAQETL